MSHASIPAAVRETRGLTEDLVRISVGIEDVDDLIADLDNALELGLCNFIQVSTFEQWDELYACFK
jgi:hypothetical protein